MSRNDDWYEQGWADGRLAGFDEGIEAAREEFLAAVEKACDELAATGANP